MRSLQACARGLVAEGQCLGEASAQTSCDEALLCPPFPRDYFITCPVIDMARLWARRACGNVFMYHAPQSYSHGR